VTIAISVKVSEGLVLAADSALVVQGEMKMGEGPLTQGVLQVYTHAKKVAQIKDCPVGTITWGLGQIGQRTIESLVKEYANSLPDGPEQQVREIADGLHSFIEEKYKAAFGKKGGHELGLQVAGYSPGSFFPEQYVLSFPPSERGAVFEARPNKRDGSPSFGANWYGLIDAVVRLILGFEPNALELLKASGVEGAIASKIRGFEYPIIFEAMPLQDAIDFAAWVAEVVIGRQRFVVGPAQVLGPVDVAIITRHEGFTWVREKRPQISTDNPILK